MKNRFNPLLQAVVALSAFTAPLQAGILYWDGTSSTANADGGNGTWDTTSTNWDSLATAGADTAWPTTGTDNDATFGGTAATVTIASGGVTANDLTFSTTGYTIGGAGLTLNGTLPAISVTGTATINSAITSAVSGGFSKTGTGTLVLGGANSFAAGTTLVFGGTTTTALNFGNISIKNSSALSGITSVTSAGANTTVAQFQLSSGVTISGTSISLAGRSNQQTSGAVLANISGNNEWGGAITISGSGGGYGIRSDAGTLTLSGGLRSNTATRVWDVGGAGDILISGIIGGSTGSSASSTLGINKFGSGTVTLSSSGNTFAGSTRINAGTLLITNASALVNSTVDMNSADAGTLSFGPSLTTATFGALTGSRNLSLLNTNATPAAVTLSVGNATSTSYTYTGVLSGGNLYKTGTGSGTFTLDPGAGVAVSINSLSANSGTMILKSGNIGTAGIDPGQSAYTMGAGARGGTLTIDGANLTIGGARRFTIGAATSGTGNLISGSITSDTVVIGHNGAATMSQSGGTVTTTSLFHQDGSTGVYTLTGGTLIAKSIYNNTANTAGTQTFTLNLNGGTLKAASGTTNLITTNGTTGTPISVLLGTGNTQIDTSLSNATIARPMGDMSGQAGTFTKIGGNSLTITQANTYTGDTTVAAGALFVNNATGSGTGTGAVKVTGTAIGSIVATLGGTGSIDGAVTVGALGKLSPTAQASGSKMTLGSTLAFDAGGTSIFNWDLSAENTDPVTKTEQGNYGQIAVTGAVTNTAIFNIALLGGSGKTTSYTDAFWDTNKSWNNVFASSVTDLTILFTSFTGTGLTPSGSGGSIIATATGEGYFGFTGTTLTWSAVPEPTSALAGLLLGAGLLRRRRQS